MRGMSLGDEGVEYNNRKLNINMFDKNLIYLKPRRKKITNHKIREKISLY